MKHTPGPWWYRQWATVDDPEQLRAIGIEPVPALTNEGERVILAGKGDDAVRVGTVSCQTEFKRGQGYRTECEVREANARLMCAAPDLLEALKDVVRVADRKTEAFDRARAAIAKAEGTASEGGA